MPRSPNLRKSLHVSGEWHRSTQYRVLNREHPIVFPATESQLVKFNPWSAFQRNEAARLTERQPYLALLELGKNVREHRGKESQLALDWCNENGLLGIIPAVAPQIFFAPSVEKELEPSSFFVARQWRYIRSGGIWGAELFEGASSENLQSAWEEARDLDLAPPRSHTMGWGREHFHERRFISTFFPLDSSLLSKSPPSPPIPVPGSSKFFQVYGEPAHAIAFWAAEFEAAITALSQKDERTEPAFRFLAALASAADPAFRLRKNGKIEEARVAAAPLASFALMVLWDLAEGRLIRSCKACGKYLVSRDARAGYCSVTCRNTAQSRRYRAKKKIKLPKEG